MVYSSTLKVRWKKDIMTLMIIDFHTHFFPDTIAAESVEHLARASGIGYFGDGTMHSLLSFMREDGVALSVNLPVATRPEQVHGINRKMIAINAMNSGVICSGAMHPAYEKFDEELAFLRANGIKGIKLHSEYQEFRPEDTALRPLFESCARNGIMVLFHSGADLGYPDVHCTPRGISELVEIEGLTIILAHMGGYRMWDEVEKYLMGKNMYLDLAYCNEMDNDQLKRMIMRHGSDKILFATDFPWERARVMKQKLDALQLDAEDRDNILFKSASRLLRIPIAHCL